MKKKILVFEDEWSTIKGSFELANIYAFNGELEYETHPKSQEVYYGDWDERYDAVFVDITLAKNSKWDGFSIISTIKEKQLFDLKKVIIMTGNSKVEDRLIENGIDARQLTILYKPIAFDELAEVLKKVLV